METKLLASFAINARLRLLDAVRSKISSVLLENSLARKESPRMVAVLEDQISSASVESVVNEVAYIWFNRLLVLTMLDNVGYNQPKAVTPQEGAILPEILQRAKSGAIDSQVHSEAAANRVRGLLSGHIPSNSPDMEAYGILLSDVCRSWGSRFPLVFKSNYELADLLTPFDLLSSASIRAMFIQEIGGEYSKEVETIGWLFQFYNSDVKKAAFEKFKSGKKADHEDLVAATQIFTPKSVASSLVENTIGTLWAGSYPDSSLAHSLPARAKADLEVSGNLEPEQLTVLDPACGSGNLLLSAYDRLEEIYLESGYNPDSIPSLILENNLHGLDIDPRAAALAAFAIWLRASRNLNRSAALNLPQPNVHFLRDSDALRALASESHDKATATRLSLAASAGILGSLVHVTSTDVEFVKQAGEKQGLLGSPLTELVPALELLSRRYFAVLANPPYMGPRNMPPILKELIESKYLDGKADLYAAFMVRCANLAEDAGRFSLVVQLSWMKIKRFANLRKWFIRETREQSFILLGSGIFEGVGSVVRSVVVSAGKTGSDVAVFAIAESEPGSERHVKLSSFESISGSPFLFELPEFLIEAKSSHPILADITTCNSGIQTGENSSFVRYRWEVSDSKYDGQGRNSIQSDPIDRKWFPYVKGAGPSRWFSLCINVIDWKNNGARLRTGLKEDGSKRNFQIMSERFMFKPYVTYSAIAEKAAFRYVDEGHLTDLASPAIQSSDLFWLLAFMNSSPVRRMTELSNPTLNIKQNDWSGVPILEEFPQLSDLGREAYQLSKNNLDTLEISSNFDFAAWQGQDGESLGARLSKISKARVSAYNRLAEIEQSIDLVVNEVYGYPWLELGAIDIEDDTDQQIDSDGEITLAYQEEELLHELLSLAIGIRFGSLPNGISHKALEDFDNIAPLLEVTYFDDDLVETIPNVLREAFGINQNELVKSIEAILGKPFKSWLSKDFYAFHLKMYKNAPIYWMITSPKGHFKALTYIHRLSLDTFATCRSKYVQPLLEKLRSQQTALGSSDPKKTAALEVQIQDISELDDLLYDVILTSPRLDFDEGVARNHERFVSVLRKLK